MEVPVWLSRAFRESEREVDQEIGFAALLETRDQWTLRTGRTSCMSRKSGVRVMGTTRGIIPGWSRAQWAARESLMRVAGNTISSAEAARFRTITMLESGSLRFVIWGSHSRDIIECHGYLQGINHRCR